MLFSRGGCTQGFNTFLTALKLARGSVQKVLNPFSTNKNVQSAVLNYIDKNNINTNFTNNLRKLFDAVPINTISEGKGVIQYNYNNSEYDENINLFLFNEVKVFNNELGLLLFNNDWNKISFTNENNSQEEKFFLAYGGGTNSITIHL
jgi:hypothetical protein